MTHGDTVIYIWKMPDWNLGWDTVVASDCCGLLEPHQINTGILHQIGPALYVLSSLLLLKSPYHSALYYVRYWLHH